MKTKENRGFTLAELLIVVAIIAVLVAIAIPILSSSLERARESADVANLRNAYAEAAVEAMTSDKGYGVAYTDYLQSVKEFDHHTEIEIGGITLNPTTGEHFMVYEGGNMRFEVVVSANSGKTYILLSNPGTAAEFDRGAREHVVVWATDEMKADIGIE